MRPAADRALSFPDDTSIKSFEERTPRAADFPKAGTEGIARCLPLNGSPQTEAQRRSWLLASKELKPLIIPSAFDDDQDRGESQNILLGGIKDLPPKVPPKSPRTESRASPRPNTRQSPHSASSSVSTSFSATSAKSNSNSYTWSENSSPHRLRTPIHIESPSSNLRGMENVVTRSLPMPSRNNSPSGQQNIVESVGTKHPPFPRADIPSAKPRSHRHLDDIAPPTLRSNTDPSETPESDPNKLSTKNEILAMVAKTAKPRSTESYHQRGHSKLVNIDVAPKRTSLARADTASIHGLLQTIVKSPTHRAHNMNLPSGFKAIDAIANVPPAEAKALKQQADRQIEKFEVLQGKDVSMLSQELDLLDERCSYLQSTHRSLRQGRRNLHTRMITYLKSPRMAKFSRDSVLKQEEALAELDVSIDDWVSKLEVAEERRTQIRQRLLEHVAAAVTLQIGGQPTLTDVEQPTPPTSPEDDDDYISTERRDVQSIKIYADEGVAALLAEIEKEIDFMADTGVGV